MNSRRRLFFALAVLPLLACSAFHAQAQNRELHQVRRIYVATMGSGEAASHFREILQDQLRNVDFEVTDSTDDADAVLTGEFSAESHDDKSFARATVTLKSRDEKRTLWSGDYVSQHRGQGNEDVVRTVAENCAQHLKEDWDKAGD